MVTDLWHYWLLMRALLVFVLAAPLIVAALLVRGRDRAPGSEHEIGDAPVPPSAIAATQSDQAPEARLGVSPRQWGDGPAVPTDRRAA